MSWTNRSRLAGNEAATKQVDQDRPRSVPDRREAERSRRSRRWARHQLDALVGTRVPAPVEIDYRACGLDLGWLERVAAGRALRERAA